MGQGDMRIGHTDLQPNGVVRVVAKGTYLERLARRDLQLKLYANTWPRDSSGKVIGASESRRIDAWCRMEDITRERGRQIVRGCHDGLNVELICKPEDSSRFDAFLREHWYA